MARIRSIKPEFWVSEQIAEFSTNARLTFVGLWNFCDDQGVHPAKQKTLKAELYPMDDITAAQVGEWVDELIRAGLVREFVAAGDGERYWHVTGWSRHQKIDRPSCKHPGPPSLEQAAIRRTLADASPNGLDEDSSNARRAPPPGVDRSGKEGSGEESRSLKSRRRTPAPQTLLPPDFGISDRVRSWAKERSLDRLEEHLEHFRLKAGAKGYKNADWDLAFMGAVRDDWAKLRSSSNAGQRNGYERDTNPAWLAGTGFPDVFAAENANCGPGNATKFRNGERVEA
jgi:hypothetical protein